MILYAEHSFNASTFAARVIASTTSDVGSAITGAIGALKGPLHGGANEKVMEVMKEIDDPKKAKDWILKALKTNKRLWVLVTEFIKNKIPEWLLCMKWLKECLK